MISLIERGRLRLEPIAMKTAYVLEPWVLLGLRLFMARAFLVSGWPKLRNLLEGDWERTVLLFRDIHPVPLLPPEIAAVLGTAGEVGFSTLLIIGLFSRLAALGLIGMVAVIETTGVVPWTLAAQAEPIGWMLMLLVIFVYGPGKISMDRLVFGRR